MPPKKTTVIDEIKNNPKLLAELYDSMRLVLRPWEENRLSGGIAIGGYTRRNVFGDTIVSLEKVYPKWNIEMPLEDSDEVKKFKSSLDPIFTSYHAKEKVRNEVDKFLTEKGYLLIPEDKDE